MGLWLKQSTAIDFLAGPFIDDTDGKTPETALTVTAAEVRLSKNGGNMAAKNEATALAHDELGMYVCKFDATDTNTLGTLQVTIWESGALLVYHEFMVVPANTYNSLVSGSDYIDSQVRGLDNIDLSATMKTSVNTEADTALTDYDPPTKTEMDTAHALLATVAKQDVIDGIVDNILVDTGELQTDWANGGRLDLLIDAIKAITDTLVLADIADAVHDEVVDAAAPANANSLRECINVMMAVLAGKSSGGGTATNVFRNTGDTKNRVSATVDADGNRDAVGTLDGT